MGVILANFQRKIGSDVVKRSLLLDVWLGLSPTIVWGFPLEFPIYGGVPEPLLRVSHVVLRRVDGVFK